MTKIKVKNVLFFGHQIHSWRAHLLLQQLLRSYTHSVCLEKNYFSGFGGSVGRVVYLLNRGVNWLLSVIALLRADIVYILPRSAWSHILLLTKLTRPRIILDYHGSSYVTQVRSRKFYSDNSKKAHKILSEDIKILKISDIIFVASVPEFHFNLSSLALSPDMLKSKIIPIGLPVPELHNFYSCKTVKERGVLRESSTLAIGWWGYPSPVHGLDVIFSALEKLNLRGFRFHFYMYVGLNHFVKPYERMAEERNISHLVTLNADANFNNLSLVKEISSNIHVSLGLFGADTRVGEVMSNKVIESCMLGVPNISPHNRSLAEYFTDRQDIIFVENSPDGIADVLSATEMSFEFLGEIGEHAHELYQNRFSSRSFVEKISCYFDA